MEQESKTNAGLTDSLNTMLEQQLSVEKGDTSESGTTTSATDKEESKAIRPESPKEGVEFTGDNGVKERFDGEEWVVIEDSPKFKIGDEEYTNDEIDEWRKSYDNSNNWKKENTQKAQEIAEKRKNIDNMIPFIQKLQDLSKDGDEDAEVLMESINDHFGKDVIKKVLSFDENTKYEHPDTDRVKSITEEKERLEISVNRYNDLWELCKKHHISQRKAEKIEKFAMDRYENSGSLLSLEDALILYEKSASKETIPKPSDKTKGASGISKEVTIPRSGKELKEALLKINAAE